MTPGQLFGPDTMNAPWGLESRLKLVALACQFFNASKVSSNHTVIGKAVPEGGTPQPLTVLDFLEFLQVCRVFGRTPNAFRVARIVERMVGAGLLIRVSYGQPSNCGLGDHYLYMPIEAEVARGSLHWVSVLGPEFLYQLCAPNLVHITGKKDDGRVAAGTGFVVHPSFVLTCHHVLSDMKVDDRQRFQGKEYAVPEESIHPHPDVDVAAIRVSGEPLTPLKGAVYQAPVVAQTVYTLGYPKLPGLIDASVTMQQGSSDQRVGYVTGRTQPVPVLGDFQTWEQRWSGNVRRRLRCRALRCGCNCRVPTSRGVFPALRRHTRPSCRRGG